MPVASRIEIVRPQDLTPQDEALWTAFLAEDPDLSGPYFDIRYLKAVGRDVPRAGVARFYDGDTVVGYFPYQVRSGALQPLGTPLSDYHGIIGAEDVEIDFEALLRATGARRLEFQGWIGSMAEKAAGLGLRRRVADTAHGFDHWWNTQNASHHKFFKNIGRCQRNVEKDFGGLAFTWERVTPKLLDWVLEIKRDQYRKTGMHDVFCCGWTRQLLENLAAYGDEGYGLRAGVFRHEGNIVAAEICLMSAEDVHLWFPAYDPDYYRYSLGILLAVAIIKNLSAEGIKRFDFGTGGEDYKAPLTVECGVCLDGDYNPSPQWASACIDIAAKAIPVAEARVAAMRLSLKRRVKLIRATETGLRGWGRALISLSRRAFMQANLARAAR